MKFSKNVVAVCCCMAFVMLPSGALQAQQTSTYQYDALGRLVRVDGVVSSNSQTQIYAFDQASNRTSVSSSVDTTPHTVNGDFEIPSISNFAYDPVAPGLVFGGMAGIAANGGAFGFAAPWSSNQVAFIQANNNQAGYVDVTAVGLVIGRHYQVTFAIAQRPGYPANAVQVSINGTVVWSGTPPSSTGFTPYPTPSFLATQQTIAIRFAATATSYDTSSAVDAVNVQQLD